MNDMSMTPTASRTAACSTAAAANAWSRPHVRGRSCETPGSANHSGTSYPVSTMKSAPRSTSRWWITERRTSRAYRGLYVGNPASPNSDPSSSLVRASRNERFAMNGIVRSSEIPVTSIGGSSSTIHVATSEPTPPESRIPSEFRPQAAKKPRSSGASPRSGPLSAVNDSGPQKKVLMPASCRRGNRSMASDRNPPIRSQSGGSTANPRSCGIASSDQGAASGSNRPTRIPPASSR